MKKAKLEAIVNRCSQDEMFENTVKDILENGKDKSTIVRTHIVVPLNKEDLKWLEGLSFNEKAEALNNHRYYVELKVHQTEEYQKCMELLLPLMDEYTIIPMINISDMMYMAHKYDSKESLKLKVMIAIH